MMYIALTYDHRLIDGREAGMCLKINLFYLFKKGGKFLIYFPFFLVLFLCSVRDKIEDPARMILEL